MSFAAGGGQLLFVVVLAERWHCVGWLGDAMRERYFHFLEEDVIVLEEEENLLEYCSST